MRVMVDLNVLLDVAQQLTDFGSSPVPAVTPEEFLAAG